MDGINYGALESLRNQEGGDFDPDDMDPEMLEWLLQAYGGQLEGGEIDDKLSQARALRGVGMEQPQGRQAGRVYVAQNPLETISSTMMGIKGIRDEKSLMEDRTTLNKAQGDRASDYGKWVMEQRAKRSGAKSELPLGDDIF